MRIAKRQEANRRCRQLTPRQAIFTSSLLGCATITEAARNAGYSEKNLAQSGHQALEVLRSKMPELMGEMGLTAQMLIEKYLVPLLSATTAKLFQYKGKITDCVIVPDNHTRLLALDMVFRLTGAYATRASTTAAGPGVKVIEIDVPRPDRTGLVTSTSSPQG